MRADLALEKLTNSHLFLQTHSVLETNSWWRRIHLMIWVLIWWSRCWVDFGWDRSFRCWSTGVQASVSDNPRDDGKVCLACQDSKGTETIFTGKSTYSNINANHSDKHYVFICDYAQKIEIPFLGDQQPGDSYYLSPKNAYVFGMVDLAHQYNDVVACVSDHLHAHVYPKKEREKGSNNVASWIMKTLGLLGVLKEDNQGG